MNKNIQKYSCHNPNYISLPLEMVISFNFHIANICICISYARLAQLWAWVNEFCSFVELTFPFPADAWQLPQGLVLQLCACHSYVSRSFHIKIMDSSTTTNWWEKEKANTQKWKKRGREQMQNEWQRMWNCIPNILRKQLNLVSREVNF